MSFSRLSTGVLKTYLVYNVFGKSFPLAVVLRKLRPFTGFCATREEMVNKMNRYMRYVFYPNLENLIAKALIKGVT